MNKEIKDAIGVLFHLRTAVPNTWAIQVTVPANEVDDVWPLLQKRFTELFFEFGSVRRVGQIEIVPGEAEVAGNGLLHA